ncbi:MAG TPA: transketolase [Actinomycetota bacterium]
MAIDEQELRPDLVVHAKDATPYKHEEQTDLERLCINTIRALAMDAVQQANSGHPGTPMGLAPVGYTLFTEFLKHDPDDPVWPDRDRFVLSAGHACLLQYALLYLTGYDLSLDDIKAFRQWGSRCAGHPERGRCPGVEVSTGPLGQGVANGIGLAIAERMLAARFNRPGHEVVNHRTYVICGDGDLMEGVSAEAASLAGNLHLGKLIMFYDDNHISIEGSTELAFGEQVGERFEAYGWHVLRVSDANDLPELRRAIRTAQSFEDHPSLIVVRSVIGFGAPHKQGTASAHGSPLGPEEVAAAKANLGWPYAEPFTVPGEALEHCRASAERGRDAHAAWNDRFAAFEAEHRHGGAEFRRTVVAGELPADWEQSLPEFPADTPLSTRVASGRTLNAVAASVPELVGGSADLAPSTETYLAGFADIATEDFSGRNFHFGVREHGMGSVMNGVAAHGGLRIYGGTFFVFSDYMRPAVRMAALQELPVVYVWTHDSIGLGEDGPTHQPVEHLASLRAMPGLCVIRPADANETAQAWAVALRRRHGPTALVLSRQNLPVMADVPRDAVPLGAWVVEAGDDVVLAATGSEVQLARAAHDLLHEAGVSAQVVSMPSWELFEQQDDDYRTQVFPSGVPVLAVEAASPFGWARYADDTVTLEHFGASAPADRLFREFGFTAENVAARAKALLGSKE